jgi:hypothetical protein
MSNNVHDTSQLFRPGEYQELSLSLGGVATIREFQRVYYTVVATGKLIIQQLTTTRCAVTALGMLFCDHVAPRLWEQSDAFKLFGIATNGQTIHELVARHDQYLTDRHTVLLTLDVGATLLFSLQQAILKYGSVLLLVHFRNATGVNTSAHFVVVDRLTDVSATVREPYHGKCFCISTMLLLELMRHDHDNMKVDILYIATNTIL